MGRKKDKLVVKLEVSGIEEDSQAGAYILNCVVGEKKAKMLIDTGATHSFVTTMFVNKKFRDSALKQVALREELSLMDGSLAECSNHFIGVPLEVGGEKMLFDFVEVGVSLFGNQYEGVLGLDFLRETKSTIDCEKDCLTLNLGKMTKILCGSGTKSTGNARVAVARQGGVSVLRTTANGRARRLVAQGRFRVGTRGNIAMLRRAVLAARASRVNPLGTRVRLG